MDNAYLDMDLLRRHVPEALQVIARYWASLESRPVKSTVKPGEIYDALPASPPRHGLRDAGVRDILAQVESVVLPGLTHWQSPHFFAFFPANISSPAILGELLSAALGVQGMMWETSPACTEVETRVLDWLAQMLDLPAEFHSTSPNGGGVIQGTASEATLAALVAARHRMRGRGRGEGHVIYTSAQAHSSVIKSAMIAGLADGPTDRSRVRLISTTGTGAMDPSALHRQVQADAHAGLTPMFLCATIGTTGSGACDDLLAVGDAVQTAVPANALPWIHVDAAHLGSACICPEFRPLLAGVERVDSLAFNPHKWLLTNFDCDCFFTRDRASLTGSMSITPEYLRNAASESGTVFDYRDWHVPLGRRFRALKLWLVIQCYGVEGLREYIRAHAQMGESFAGWVRADERFEVVATSPGLICIALRKGNEATSALVERVNRAGRIYVTGTLLQGPPDGSAQYVLRMAIGAGLTQLEHVERAWAEIRDMAG